MFKIVNNRLEYTLHWPRSIWPQTANPALTVINQLRTLSPQLDQLLRQGDTVSWTSTVSDTSDQVELVISVELTATAQNYLERGLPLTTETLEQLELLANKKG